jgi:hypothetical protein
MTFMFKPILVALMIAILMLSEVDLSAQQRGTISIDRTVAFPLTAEGTC